MGFMINELLFLTAALSDAFMVLIGVLPLWVAPVRGQLSPVKVSTVRRYAGGIGGGRDAAGVHERYEPGLLDLLKELLVAEALDVARGRFLRKDDNGRLDPLLGHGWRLDSESPGTAGDALREVVAVAARRQVPEDQQACFMGTVRRISTGNLRKQWVGGAGVPGGAATDAKRGAASSGSGGGGGARTSWPLRIDSSSGDADVPGCNAAIDAGG